MPRQKDTVDEDESADLEDEVINLMEDPPSLLIIVWFSENFGQKVLYGVKLYNKPGTIPM